MKLAEALKLRADLTTRSAELLQRARNSAVVQEGYEAAENPTELLAQQAEVLDQIEALVVAINTTNLQTMVGQDSMTAALAKRDRLRARHRTLVLVAQSGEAVSERGTRSELRWLPQVSVSGLRREADDLARQIRELDLQIQQANWTTELLEN